MAVKSKQLTKDGNIVLDYDNKVRVESVVDKLRDLKIKANIYKWNNKKTIKIKTNDSIIFLLVANITYLGNPHPTFKKRMQLKQWYKDFVDEHNDPVLFLGIYTYDNVFYFVNFYKNNYLQNKINNSSAHVYINDFYQSYKYGVFQKHDLNDNIIDIINDSHFKQYLENNTISEEGDIFNILNHINEKFPFGIDIYSHEAIPEMFYSNYKNWKQAEWPGFYLEFMFDNIIKSLDTKKINGDIVYIDRDPTHLLDFDIYFTSEDFYGDLKASSDDYKEIIGNDLYSIEKTIEEKNKFWYLVYEHQTEKDSKKYDYSSTRHRNLFIYENDKKDKQKLNELSYYKRMKRRVKFKRMFVLELNPINFKEIIEPFKQGRQPDGSARKLKIKFNKDRINNSLIYTWDAHRKKDL